MNMKYHIETAWQHCIGNIVSLIILTLVVAAVSVVSIGILAPVALAGYTDSLFQLLKHNPVYIRPHRLYHHHHRIHSVCSTRYFVHHYYFLHMPLYDPDNGRQKIWSSGCHQSKHHHGHKTPSFRPYHCFYYFRCTHHRWRIIFYWFFISSTLCNTLSFVCL